MNKKSAEEEQEFFMRISNPNIFRRNLLEASKLTLTILKQTHRVKQIREAKHEAMSLIAKEVKELRLLVQKADELLPNYTKAELKKFFPETKTKELSEEKTETPAPKIKSARAAVSEVDKLTQAIEDIQRKLQSL